MEIKNINEIIFRLYMYMISIKKIHYTTESNHLHELCDKVYNDLYQFIDEFAEQMYGYYGNPQYKDFKPLNKINLQESEDLSQLIDNIFNILNYIKKYNKEANSDSINSIIDDFSGKLNKYIFLSRFDKLSK